MRHVQRSEGRFGGIDVQIKCGRDVPELWDEGCHMACEPVELAVAMWLGDGEVTLALPMVLSCSVHCFEFEQNEGRCSLI